MREWTSREEEASFPEFESFQTAWGFFVGKYGKDVVLESIDFVGKEKCYFCVLVTDWVAYDEMNRLLEEGEPVVGMKYLNCRQPIQIFESGHVHIVH